MRKSISFMMICLVAVFALAACGGGDNGENGGNGANGGGGAAAAADAYALYKKEGRNWTHSMAGDMKMKTTVKSVADDHAMTETQMYGADGEPMGDPTDAKVDFVTAEATNGETAEQPEKKTDTVNAAGRDWKVVSYDDGKTWMSEEFPALIIKSESMNLVEWND
jgi:hypothetical protein